MENIMMLDEAITHAKKVAASKCDECGKEHQQLAEWLQELVDSRKIIKRMECELKADHLQAIDTANRLAAYEDKTCISEDWLLKNGFGKRIITNGKPTLPSPNRINPLHTLTLDTLTVGEFNTLLDIVKLQKFKIKLD